MCNLLSAPSLARAPFPVTRCCTTHVHSHAQTMPQAGWHARVQTHARAHNSLSLANYRSPHCLSFVLPPTYPSLSPCSFQSPWLGVRCIDTWRRGEGEQRLSLHRSAAGMCGACRLHAQSKGLKCLAQFKAPSLSLLLQLLLLQRK